MITYEMLRQVEGDTDKHTNYQLNQYEFPFPENSVLIERDKEAKRIQRSFVTSIKQSLLNNNN
jgi:hypothetical protein